MQRRAGSTPWRSWRSTRWRTSSQALDALRADDGRPQPSRCSPSSRCFCPPGRWPWPMRTGRLRRPKPSCKFAVDGMHPMDFAYGQLKGMVFGVIIWRRWPSSRPPAGMARRSAAPRARRRHLAAREKEEAEFDRGRLQQRGMAVIELEGLYKSFGDQVVPAAASPDRRGNLGHHMHRALRIGKVWTGSSTSWGWSARTRGRCGCSVWTSPRPARPWLYAIRRRMGMMLPGRRALRRDDEVRADSRPRCSTTGAISPPERRARRGEARSGGTPSFCDDHGEPVSMRPPKRVRQAAGHRHGGGDLFAAAQQRTRPPRRSTPSHSLICYMKDGPGGSLDGHQPRHRRARCASPTGSPCCTAGGSRPGGRLPPCSIGRIPVFASAGSCLATSSFPSSPAPWLGSPR